MATTPKGPPVGVVRGSDVQYLACPQSKSLYKAGDPAPKGKPKVPNELQAFLPRQEGPAVGTTVIVKAQSASHQALISAEIDRVQHF